MQTMTLTPPVERLPAWLRATAALGILWNAYGVAQYASSWTQTPQSLMAAGMTAAQAEIYLGLPPWMGLVFAIGVFAGLLGSVALALRRGIAVPVFALSLVGYICLFAGDVWYGVFTHIPAQLAILAFVVVVAAGLLGAARAAAARGLLR